MTTKTTKAQGTLIDVPAVVEAQPKRAAKRKVAAAKSAPKQEIAPAAPKPPPVRETVEVNAAALMDAARAVARFVALPGQDLKLPERPMTITVRPETGSLYIRAGSDRDAVTAVVPAKTTPAMQAWSVAPLPFMRALKEAADRRPEAVVELETNATTGLTVKGRFDREVMADGALNAGVQLFDIMPDDNVLRDRALAAKAETSAVLTEALEAALDWALDAGGEHGMVFLGGHAVVGRDPTGAIHSTLLPAPVGPREGMAMVGRRACGAFAAMQDAFLPLGAEVVVTTYGKTAVVFSLKTPSGADITVSSRATPRNDMNVEQLHANAVQTETSGWVLDAVAAMDGLTALGDAGKEKGRLRCEDGKIAVATAGGANHVLAPSRIGGGAFHAAIRLPALGLALAGFPGDLVSASLVGGGKVLVIAQSGFNASMRVAALSAEEIAAPAAPAKRKRAPKRTAAAKPAVA